MTLRLRPVACVAVMATLVLGAGCGDDGADPGSVSPGAEELTDRQSEMVDVVEGYVQAWAATDGDAVASFMTDDGVVVYPEQGWTFSVTDRSLQDRVTNGPYATLHTLDPKLVYENRIVLAGRIDSMDLPWLSVVAFTETGDVEIVSETIFLSQ